MAAGLSIETLIKRAEISDLVLLYATAVDTRDWARYRSIFEDEVLFDFSDFTGDPASMMPADEWVRIVSDTLSGFDATQHISSNHVITFGDDHATCVSYVVASHYLLHQGGTKMYSLGGFYTNKLVEGKQGWRISECCLKITWEMGDRELFEIAANRVNAG